jgi:hypothetical protein
MSETERQLERLAKRLGGGWRIEQGVMPLILLTQREAERLVERLDSLERPMTSADVDDELTS